MCRLWDTLFGPHGEFHMFICSRDPKLAVMAHVGVLLRLLIFDSEKITFKSLKGEGDLKSSSNGNPAHA